MCLAFGALLDLVRTKFAQADLKATDKVAWDDNQAHRARIQRAFEDRALGRWACASTC